MEHSKYNVDNEMSSNDTMAQSSTCDTFYSKTSNYDQDLSRRQSMMMHDNNANAISKYININSLTGKVKWSMSDDNIVKNFMEKAMAYKVLYNRAYFHYRTCDKFLKWPLAILSCCSLLLQAVFATLLTSDSLSHNGQLIFAIIIACLTGIVTSITYWRSRESYDNSADGCRKAAIAFSEFADQLNTILSINKEHRTNPLEVINAMQYDYRKIRKLHTEFVIPSRIYKKFINKHTNQSLIMDIATSNTEHYDIFDDSYDKKTIVTKFLEKLTIAREENINNKQNSNTSETIHNMHINTTNDNKQKSNTSETIHNNTTNSNTQKIDDKTEHSYDVYIDTSNSDTQEFSDIPHDSDYISQYYTESSSN